MTKKKVTYIDSHTAYCMYPESGNGLDNLSNTNAPFILYSLSCSTTPFDTYEGFAPISNLGSKFTNLYGKGGPAYFGNTRYGYVTSSWYLQRAFTSQITGFQFHLGKAEANSKGSSGSHYVWLSHNLVGCPETELWTNTPSEFSNAYASICGNDVIVNTGGLYHCTVCIMSSNDGGATYWSVDDSFSSEKTFSNVPTPFTITITKHDYIPLVIQSSEIFMSVSSTISGSSTVCNGGTSFEIENVPDGSNIIWTQSSNISLTSAQGSNPCTFSPNGSENGWIHAQVITICNDTFNLPNKTVWVGAPTSIDSIQGDSNVIVDESNGYHIAFNNDCNPTNYYWGTSPYADISPASGYDWTNIIFPDADNYTVYASVQNTCGMSPWANKAVSAVENKNAKLIKSENEDQNIIISVAPNPASQEITISINSIDKDLLEKSNWDISIYDQNTKLITKLLNLEKDRVKLNIQNWTEGIYIVKVEFDNYTTHQKFIIAK